MASSTAEFRSKLIEKLTLGVAQSLGKRQGVCDVHIDQKGPADRASVNHWESNHCCSLPADLKQFYQTTNGFLLTWKVKMKDELIPVGRIELNPVNKLEKISGYCSSTQQGNSGSYSLMDVDLPGDEDKNGNNPRFDGSSRIYELDPCSNLGKVCLVYRNTKSGVPAKEADYWFLDKSLQWHFITSDFQSYFRLMLSNIGLPQWHYLYTDIGVSPSVQQWYSLYTPVRLETEAEYTAEETLSTSDIIVNNVDLNRVFKGKDKKKATPAATTQAAANRRKAGSPQPSKAQALRGSSSAALMKSATAPFYR